MSVNITVVGTDMASEHKKVIKSTQVSACQAPACTLLMRCLYDSGTCVRSVWACWWSGFTITLHDGALMFASGSKKCTVFI